jgi:manganese oxidase
MKEASGRAPARISRRGLLGGAVATAGVAAGARPRGARAAAEAPTVREYWVVARNRRWNVSPTGRDDWRNQRVAEQRFDALSYVATEPGFGRPLPSGGVGDNTGIPGPVFRGHPGDEIVVHFRNDDRMRRRPHTIHPHGVHYAPEFDGTFMGRYTPPGGAVEAGETFTYRWQVVEDSVGVWPYHDHGPFEHESTDRGLFGAIVITPRDDPRPDTEATIYFHHLNPNVTGFNRTLSVINGRAHAGNTPTIRARSGQDVAFNVLTLGNEFHTFHIHGHRWLGPHGQPVDSPNLSSAEGLRARLREDSPGRWLYHCHVMDHMHHGMVGYYLVE